MCGWRRALAALTAAIFVACPAAVAQEAGSAPRPVVPVSALKSGFFQGDVWLEPDRGFMYYQPDGAPTRKRVEEPKKDQVVIGKRRLEDITEHDDLKREREARLQIAIMSPTPENMKLYQEANNFMLKKSAMFADMWRRSLWDNPELDYNSRSPSANFASTAIKLERDAQRKQVVASLASEFGIVFFARSDCPYCKLQAPVLKMLQQQYGVEVLAVTLDGRPVEGFPEAKPDNGISFRVTDGRGVSIVPTMFLVSRARSGEPPQARSLVSGVLALDEIVERIHVLTQLRPGEDIFGGEE